MEKYVYLILGFALLVVAIFDFFFTTLSGSGSAFLSRSTSGFAHKVQLALSAVFGRKTFSLSGMLINLAVLAMWLLLVWLGLFLVFSYNPEAITNSSGRAASSIERLYFTGYILSTLGVGNFIPTSPFFELLTSLFSFFGFIFFTTSMTYLISVSSAVVHKRSLALAIRNLGSNPVEMVKNLLEQDSSLSFNQFLTLQQMIERHSVNHQAYPVVHYYNNPDIASSLSINIAILDEAVSILLYSTRKPYFKELQTLRNSLSSFLHHVEERYGLSSEKDVLIQVNWFELSLPIEVTQGEIEKDPRIFQRRKVLDSLLKSEGFSWNEVYQK